MVIQTFVLHLVPDGVRPKIYLSQHDTGLSTLRFELVDVNTYYEIPSGSKVIFVGTKSDKKMFSYACTYSGHTVFCNVTEQMTTTPGCIECELQILGSDAEVHGSINVELVVERSPLTLGICSKNDFASADEEIITIHQEVSQAITAADEAKEAADSIIGTKEQTIAEMWSAVDSIHGLIENGFVINYFEETQTIQFIN